MILDSRARRQDLDLYVEDGQGQVVGASEKKQAIGGKSDPGNGDASSESRNPRERIVLTDLAADRDHDYLIRIKAKAGAFTAEVVFDPAAGWDTEKADAWLAERLPAASPGRLAVLPRSPLPMPRSVAVGS